MDATKNTIIQEGMEALTLNIVAKNSGISKGGLLHHFPSKVKLLDEIFNESLNEILTALNEKKLEDKENFDPVIMYLKMCSLSNNEDKRRATMMIIIQAFCKENYYRTKWDKFVSENIYDNSKKKDTSSLMTILLADGLWFAEIFQLYHIDNKQKIEILNSIKKLK